jgi:polyisoprenoid-binding protein YceI
MKSSLAALAAVVLLAVPAMAQTPAGPPGKADASRVVAATYKVDPDHTQVIWTVDHMGVSPLTGMFGRMTGTLVLDPAKPSAAKLDVEIPLTGLTTTTEGFGKHLRTADFFDAEKFPTGRFVSTSVQAKGAEAVITGDLTLHGVTKPVTMQAKFFGAGPNPQTKALNIGFTATARIKRSDFGLGFAVPVVADDVDLKIVGAFEK